MTCKVYGETLTQHRQFIIHRVDHLKINNDCLKIHSLKFKTKIHSPCRYGCFSKKNKIPSLQEYI